MRTLGIAGVAVGMTVGLAFGPTGPATGAEDVRQVLRLPPEMRAEFLGEMRHHMDSFDDVLAQVAAGDFHAAAKVAADELVPGAGKGFGRYLPIEFREMGLGMHRAAADFSALAAAAPADPAPADWKAVVSSLQVVSAHCRACHATFRME